MSPTDPPARSRRLRSAFRGLLLVAGVVLVPLSVLVLLPLTLLIGLGQTAAGRVAGGAALAVLAALGALAVAWRAPTRDWRHVLAVAVPAVSAVGLYVALVRLAPSGRSPDGDQPGLRSVFPGPLPFRRTALVNLVPEVDQVALGSEILTRIDPWMSLEHARRIRRVLPELYGELRVEPAHRELGVVANYALAELIGGAYDSGHYYAYVPPHQPGERLGAIVFLHGNAGNFQSLCWAWKPFAEACRVVIVCPSFGYGFWNEGGVEAVERAREHAFARLPVDPARVYLGGISDGGKGVTRSGAAHADRYAGLIYVSPTMVLDEVRSPTFVGGWRGRPVLILHGADDHNVSRRDVDKAAEAMRRGGVDVTYACFPGEDHFLFFGRRDELLARVAAWIDRPMDSERTGQ